MNNSPHWAWVLLGKTMKICLDKEKKNYYPLICLLSYWWVRGEACSVAPIPSTPSFGIFWFHPNNITIFSWVRLSRVWQPRLDIKRVFLSGEIDSVSHGNILFNLFKQVFTFSSQQFTALEICLLLQMRNISYNNIIILGSKLHLQIFTIRQ